MSIKTLIEKLKKRAAVTPVTPRFDDAGQAVAVLAVTAVAENPDALFWPESSGLSTPELDRLSERTMLFIRRGLDTMQAEQLAFKLIDRDREQDAQRVCMECANLSSGWRCANWKMAGVARHARDAQLPADLVTMQQHCPGFSNAIQLKKETP